MSSLDRFEDDVNRIFMGAEVHEEPLVFTSKSGSVSIPFDGTVDIDSFNTGDGAENEINRSMSKLCMIYAPSIIFTVTPIMYDTVYQESEGVTWNIKQLKREHGMWTFQCTAGESRRRGRIR